MPRKLKPLKNRRKKNTDEGGNLVFSDLSRRRLPPINNGKNNSNDFFWSRFSVLGKETSPDDVILEGFEEFQTEDDLFDLLCYSVLAEGYTITNFNKHVISEDKNGYFIPLSEPFFQKVLSAANEMLKGNSQVKEDIIRRIEQAKKNSHLYLEIAKKYNESKYFDNKKALEQIKTEISTLYNNLKETTPLISTQESIQNLCPTCSYYFENLLRST